MVRRQLCCVVAVLAIGGCSAGSTPSPRAPAPHQTGASIGGETAAAGPTVAENKAAAARYATHLLSVVHLPSGTKPLRSAPPNLGDPSSGRPGDDARYYTIPMSFGAAVNWLKTNTPKGHLTQNGTSSGGGPGYQQSGVEYTGVSNAAWQSSALNLTIESDSAELTYLQLDAVVDWLDPVPIRDTSTGPRMHFAVIDGCPSSDKNQPDVTNAFAGLDRQMLPSAAPTRALLCRYDNNWKLVGQHALDAAMARSAAATIRAVPLSHVDGAIYHCPAAFGTEGYAAFEYSDGQTVDIRVDLSGCPYISNGEITTMAGNAASLFAHLGS